MSDTIAELRQVSRLFGRYPALRQVTISLEAGRCYLLLGENGAGKSTLLRVLAGLLEPTQGSVLYRPSPLGAAPGADIGYMGHAAMLYDELSATENLRYFASLYRDCECLTPQEALRSVGLDPSLERPVGQYSQGMRQRVSLARVLVPQPALLLLDEPFSNMDAASARQMLALLEKLRDSRRAVVLTTHQRELAAPLADFVLTMEAGRLVSVAAGPALEAAGLRKSH